MLRFYWYPRCSTCQKAYKALLARGLEPECIDLKTNPPSAETLRALWQASGLPLKRFFNTSGLAYRALDLKHRLETMSEEEALSLLAGDGMLIKRPLLVSDQGLVLGYKPEVYDQL